MPFNQKQIIEEAKLTYSSLGKAFKEQTKAIKDQGEEQVKVIKGTMRIIMKMSYCFQKKEKYLRIFTTLDLIE